MTPDQEKDVLQMAEDWKRIGWLMRGIATVSKWVAAVAAATTAAAVAYKTMIKP